MRVELPFLAEGVEGGDVVQVLVREGDQVTEGQSLIELETDKATVPVPAPAAVTPATETEQLPKTASSLPLTALLGGLAISLALGLKLFLRRAS